MYDFEIGVEIVSNHFLLELNVFCVANIKVRYGRIEIDIVKKVWHYIINNIDSIGKR